MSKKFLWPFMAIILILTGCSETEFASHVAKRAMPTPQMQGNFKIGNPYQVEGKWYKPQETYDLTETGIASWYGSEFHGKKTANGERFDMNELTAAHRTLQLPSLARVTNLENGRSLVVRVNDRGPFKRGRVMDVSKKAAELLGFKNQGTAKIKLQVLSKESMDMAMAAKRGEDTRGMEVALNERHYQTPPPQPTSYQQAMAETAPAPAQAPVAGHISAQGNFMPDPVVRQLPVTPTSIYVQAGSFGSAENANRLAQKMASFGNAHVFPAQVNGQQFFRVRLGPIASVEKADFLLGKVASSGNKNAIIVVE